MDAKIVINAEILSPTFVLDALVHWEKELALVSDKTKNAVNSGVS